VEQKYAASKKSGEVPSYEQGGVEGESSDEDEEDPSDEIVERVMLETTEKPEEKEEEVEVPASTSAPTTKAMEVETEDQVDAGADADAEMEEDEEDEIPEETSTDSTLTLEQKLLAARSFHPTHCLFCHKKSPTIERSFEHMFKAHSFYVPERQYLADPTGFLLYLAEKLAVGNVCLFCETEFGTLEGVRGHMKDKRHQKIRYEDENDKAEFAEWYDFASSYPDAEERRLKDVARAERREARRIRREDKEERRRKREEELEGDGGWEEDEVEGGDEDQADEIIVEDEGEESSEVESDTDESDFSVSLLEFR
jgi:pre-60S factor REI1